MASTDPYLIHSRSTRELPVPALVAMKSPLGPLPVGFEELEEGEMYIAGNPKRANLGISRAAELLSANPELFTGIDSVLIIPSMDALVEMLRRPASFDWQAHLRSSADLRAGHAS